MRTKLIVCVCVTIQVVPDSHNIPDTFICRGALFHLRGSPSTRCQPPSLACVSGVFASFFIWPSVVEKKQKFLQFYVIAEVHFCLIKNPETCPKPLIYDQPSTSLRHPLTPEHRSPTSFSALFAVLLLDWLACVWNKNVSELLFCWIQVTALVWARRIGARGESRAVSIQSKKRYMGAWRGRRERRRRRKEGEPPVLKML